MVDSGEDIEMERVPSSHGVQMEQSIGGRHQETDFETKSAIYTSETIYGNEQRHVATTDDQLPGILAVSLGENNLVTPEGNITIKLEPTDMSDDLVNTGDVEIALGDTMQQYPVTFEPNPKPRCGIEYIQTTDDRLIGFENCSYPSYVVKNELSDCAMGQSLELKTEVSDCLMEPSHELKTEVSDCLMEPSRELKTENSECAMGQSFELKTENSDYAMGQSFEMNSHSQSVEMRTDIEESDGIDSAIQIKIEPGSVPSPGAMCDDTYYMHGVIFKRDDKVRTETDDVIAGAETNEIQEEDSSLFVTSELDPDRVATKLEVVSMIVVVLWPVVPIRILPVWLIQRVQSGSEYQKVVKPKKTS
jgi:hypothetical protein